jgi:DNA-binding NtrC family response regulator
VGVQVPRRAPFVFNHSTSLNFGSTLLTANIFAKALKLSSIVPIIKEHRSRIFLGGILDNTTTKALIVDDELYLREALAEILQEDFSHVETAVDGPSAIAKLESFDADLIITDLKMPGFDGIELVRRIRATGNMVPVIFVTAHADKDIAISALRLGVSDVLEKPFDYKTVKKCVYRVLKIASANVDIVEFKKKYGDDSPEVKRFMRIVGLLQAISSLDKAG